jgi:adenine deaminase
MVDYLCGMSTTTLLHHLVDLHSSQIFPAEIIVENDRIVSVKESSLQCEGYILPGFIDAHVHIESSMLIPSEFARMAVKHGTVATISDPHEIANVCGIEGVEYMIHNAKKVPFKFHFGAPSCVPATGFETAGSIIDSNGIEQLMQREDIYYLSEMMNYPGVLFHDEEVMKKIAIAHKYNKPVDGHAPGLRGENAKQYIDAGISTDHECVTYDEAYEKLSYGMKILIREGSAAKNFDALVDLINDNENQLMFCCDDKHPDELILHHINNHVKRALAKDIDIFKVLKVACVNPVLHYNLDVGLLREGDKADFIVIDNLTDFTIRKTVIDGVVCYENGEVKFDSVDEKCINQFSCDPKLINEFAVEINEQPQSIKVIEALDGQLITRTKLVMPKIQHGQIVSDIDQDVLKMVVVNRYTNAPIAKAFIHHLGLKKGAIASTVAHDSHNIICVGVNDEMICKAVNALIECKGGIVVVDDEAINVMPLPVAGLMSNEKAEVIAEKYSELDHAAKQLGSNLSAPFMTLSFMALLVIPQLKLSDKGLFDGEKFEFVDLY